MSSVKKHGFMSVTNLADFSEFYLSAVTFLRCPSTVEVISASISYPLHFRFLSFLFPPAAYLCFDTLLLPEHIRLKSLIFLSISGSCHNNFLSLSFCVHLLCLGRFRFLTISASYHRSLYSLLVLVIPVSDHFRLSILIPLSSVILLALNLPCLCSFLGLVVTVSDHFYLLYISDSIDFRFMSISASNYLSFCPFSVLVITIFSHFPSVCIACSSHFPFLTISASYHHRLYSLLVLVISVA